MNKRNDLSFLSSPPPNNNKKKKKRGENDKNACLQHFRLQCSNPFGSVDQYYIDQSIVQEC